MKPTLFWIPGHWLGKFAIIARPRGGDWLDQEVQALQSAGIDVLVSLFLTVKGLRPDRPSYPL